MQVVQTVFGVFHHFELARELERRGYLQAIYSTWPWARLKREGLPRTRVRTFPIIHMAEMLLGRTAFLGDWLSDELGYVNAVAFDSWTAHQMTKDPPPDVLIGISGSSLQTGRRLQARGGTFICDRGSSHHRFQETVLGEEYSRWGIKKRVSDPRDTRREEEIYATADAITVPSSFAAESFVDMGVARNKVHTIPLGVRLENFHRSSEPPPISQRFEVLFAGHVSFRKGIPYLLQGFAKVRHPHKRLRIVGALEPELKQLIPKLPTADVELVGPVPQTELRSIMSTSHVLVLPSIEDGFGMVLSQAMACGCPVIASTNTGGPDLIDDGVDGYIVPIREADAVFEKLQRFADNPDLQARFSDAALARVRSSGGWSDYGDRWAALLGTLTEARAVRISGQPSVVAHAARSKQ